MPDQMSTDDWPAMRTKLAAVIREKTRDQWDEIMLGTDICYAPVLNFDEAIDHPHNESRNTFVEAAGVKQAAPAPRFSRTSPQLPAAAVAPGSGTVAVLQDLGLSEADIAALQASGAVA